MSDVIATDAQALEVDSNILEFFELEIGIVPLQADGTPETGNNKLYFHPAKDLDSTDSEKDIIFDGNTYVAFPISMEGIESKSDGAMAKPTITIANVESILKTGSDFKTSMDVSSGSNVWNAEFEGRDITSSNFTIKDLVGCRVTRRKTFEKYTGTNTVYEFPKETYIIDRISDKNQVFIELELSTPADLDGVQLPRRVIVGKYCPWLYQGNIDPKTEKSACYWKKTKQIKSKSTNGFYTFYFTKDDEPLVLKSNIEGSDTTAWKGTWTSANSKTYAEGEYVLHSGIYYRSKFDSNANQTPTEPSIWWQIVRPYTVWSNSTTYNINTDPRRNDYVRHDDTIWRNIKASNVNITPGTDYTAWVRGDACGKLLKSCKIRYQALPMITSTSDVPNAIPHEKLNTFVPLPFGGFPASRKFS